MRPNFVAIARNKQTTGLGHVTKQDLEEIEVALPPLPEQQAIAHILGTLDDKIELNRRMNETLEAMARALFKSWFVDFDPVRAKMEGRWGRGESLPGLPAEHYDLFPDRLVDSELGETPEGWKVKALGEFGDIVTGKTPSTKRSEYYGDDVPFLRIPDMHGKMYALETELMLSVQGANSQPQKTLPPGSISVSCIATPGLVVLNHCSTQTNQQINSIIPRSESSSTYIFWTCRHLSSQIETGGLGGSVFGNMNKSTFAALLRAVAEASVRRTQVIEFSCMAEYIQKRWFEEQLRFRLRDGTEEETHIPWSHDVLARGSLEGVRHT